MKTSALFLPLAAVAMAPMPAIAAAPASHVEASIPFANHGGVWDWRAVSKDTIYFEDGHDRWYKAKLFAPAFDLPYTELIALDTRPDGRLDKWSAVYVHGQRYPFASFVRVQGPPAKHHAAMK